MLEVRTLKSNGRILLHAKEGSGTQVGITQYITIACKQREGRGGRFVTDIDVVTNLPPRPSLCLQAIVYVFLRARTSRSTQ